jgi:hypothetical protein
MPDMVLIHVSTPALDGWSGGRSTICEPRQRRAAPRRAAPRRAAAFAHLVERLDHGVEVGQHLVAGLAAELEPVHHGDEVLHRLEDVLAVRLGRVARHAVLHRRGHAGVDATQRVAAVEAVI